MAEPVQPEEVNLDVSLLYGHPQPAKVADLPRYIEVVRALVPEGGTVRLTGPGPVWLYLVLAHAIHGIARRLVYRSPEAGEVVVFDHDSH